MKSEPMWMWRTKSPQTDSLMEIWTHEGASCKTAKPRHCQLSCSGTVTVHDHQGKSCPWRIQTDWIILIHWETLDICIVTVLKVFALCTRATHYVSFVTTVAGRKAGVGSHLQQAAHTKEEYMTHNTMSNKAAIALGHTVCRGLSGNIPTHFHSMVSFSYLSKASLQTFLPLLRCNTFSKPSFTKKSNLTGRLSLQLYTCVFTNLWTD